MDQAMVAEEVPRSSPARMPFTFAFDPRLGAESGTENIHNGFRLAFWAKDHWMGELQREAQASHPVAMGLARAVELVFVDVPLAAYATVLPHEIFGHGARYREFGGSASYHFEPPPPYSFTPSYTIPTEPVPIETSDARLLIIQSGIAVERHEAHAALVASFEADTLNHIDSGILVGVPIHEVFEATLPWGDNDVRSWTTLQADRYGLPAEGIQDRYLAATAVASFANPTFLYSCYDLFWRFLVLGERTGPAPALRIGRAALGANTHVSPTPWGLEYELDLLGRWDGAVLEVGPHWGHGPGGRSAGIDIRASEIRVLPDLVVGAGFGVWAQPELSVVSDGVPLGVLARLGGFDEQRAAPIVPGARVQAEVRWEQPFWFLGFRVGGKSAGLSGLAPIGPGAESLALAGLLLDRP